MEHVVSTASVVTVGYFGSENGANLGKWGLNIRFYDHNPEKAHLARNRVFWHILRQIDLGALAVEGCKNPPKNGKKTSRVNTFGAQSHTCAETKPHGRIMTNLRTGVGVHDIITSANFHDCRLWGLSVVGVKFWVSPLTRVVTLTTVSHYRASVW